MLKVVPQSLVKITKENKEQTKGIRMLICGAPLLVFESHVTSSLMRPMS